MSSYYSTLLGLIILVVIAIFWWLIVLDLDNQKKLKAFTTSKIKDRQYKKYT